jgi:hypothetical protein
LTFTPSGTGEADLAALEHQLQTLSHDSQALDLIQAFAKSLGKTNARQRVFNASGALVRAPIFYQDVLKRGLLHSEEDAFTLLQGDIVRTDAAYFLGERIIDTRFAIATSTCDLVPGRREYAALLRLQPLSKHDPNIKSLLGELLRFGSTQRMYLPPLPEDPLEVVANVILFDGIVQIRLEDLLLATRQASLSLVGWRIFGSLVRTIMVRAGESEVRLRSQSEAS